MTKTKEAIWTAEDVISVYSRADAIEDGVLVDVSETAREAGIKFPVAVTRRVWDEIVTPDDSRGQDEEGRLWDLVWMLRNAAARNGGSEILFKLAVVQNNKHEIVTLKAICGPGDGGEPVITVLLPEED